MAVKKTDGKPTKRKFGDGTPGPGRPKGVPNKNTKALKDMILQALDEQAGGGVGYLKVQAIENPTAFMTLLGKVLPTQLTGSGGGPIQFEPMSLAEFYGAIKTDPKSGA